MSSYKLSRYNVLFKRNEQSFLWNTLTGALIQVDQGGIDYLDKFSDSETDQEHPYFKVLLKNGCIVDAQYDELGKVLIDEKQTMLESYPYGMHYTIAPGLGCNYHCVYCFEKDRTSYKAMTEAVRDEVINFIIQQAEDNKNLGQLGITWFGGEPLLYLDTIADISKELIRYCDERKILYSAGIVTNGRYLTKEVAKALVQNKVSYVQLAIDGMATQYALSKGADENDFYQTVENLVSSAEIIPITVRINVQEEIDEAVRLTDYLLKDKHLDGKIKIYIAHIRNYDSVNMKENQIRHKKFLENEKRYMALFGKNKPYSIESLAYIKPKRRCTTCLSVCGSNYCIGPEGEFYRCEHFFGNKDCIVGSVKEGRYYSKQEVNYIQFKHLNKCEACKLFPVCLGGCMNDAMNGETAIDCKTFTERMFDYILMDY